jgi:hypothetical protein
VLRDFAFILAEPVCFIFNTSIGQAKFPQMWKMANVTPIVKRRPALSVENDIRPISLTSTLSKLLESFVGQHILRCLMNKLDPKQFGAVKGRSTTHALVDMLHIWNEALDKHQSARITFVDFRKAFDRVDHNIVMSKLNDFDVPYDVTKWLHSFMSERKQRVKIGNVTTEWKQTNGGMPQGTWLGPVVFLILINDLQSAIPIHKFVDDTTLTAIIGQDQMDRMPTAFADLLSWSEVNKMQVNTSKTLEMIIGPLAQHQPPLLTINQSTVLRATTFKLLGVTVSNDLRWKEHVASVYSKAQKRLHYLRLLKRAGVSTSDMYRFYVTIIRPVTEYACPVWHSGLTANQNAKLESVQSRALKIIGYDSADSDHILTLEERRDLLSRRFFVNSVLNSKSKCLSHLLPEDNRNRETISKLRHFNYLGVKGRTAKYLNSFVPYALRHYT